MVDNHDWKYGKSNPRHFLNPTHNPLPPAFTLPRHLNPFVDDRVSFIPVPIFGCSIPNMKTAMVCWMLERASADGQLAGIHTLVEATSGNTCAALGIAAPYYGIRHVVPVVERDIAPGKLEQLRLACCGAPQYPIDGMTAVETALEIGEQSGWLNLNQYANPANPEAHEKWTGPHVWQQTDGKLTVLVAPLGTAGTAIGASNFLRRQSGRIPVVVGVALAPGEAVPGVRTEEKLKQVAFDWRSAIDDLILVSKAPSYRASMDLIRSGRMFGPSSGLSFWGAKQFIAKRKEEGTLDSLRNGDDRVVVAFTCGDTPLPYLDKYSTVLDGSAFNPLDPSAL